MNIEEKIGLELKNQRIALGLTIEDVVNETKIRSKYLSALEDGFFEKIPGEVYRKGFLKTYARFLGLDNDALTSEYSDYLIRKDMNEKESSTVKPAHAPFAAEYSNHPEKLKVPSRQTPASGGGMKPVDGIPILRWLRNILIMILIVFSMYYTYNNLIVANLPDVPNQEDPIDTPVDEEPEEPEPVQPIVNITTDTRSRSDISIAHSNIVVKLTADARCWVRVKIDDNVPTSFTMRSGDEISYEASTSLVIRAGNSGGIQIFVHEKLLEVTGFNGGVKDYYFVAVQE